MARKNRISKTLAATDRDSVLTKMDEAKTVLSFLTNLSNEERKKLRKMGPKSVEYVKDCLNGANNFSDSLAKSFDITEFGNDVALYDMLLPIQVKVQAIAEAVKDTLMAVGSDCMEQADEVYGSLKAAAKRDANAKTLVEQIGRRYAAQKKPRKKTA